MADYINYLPIYGRGALINIIEAPRGVGKTFTAKLWGIRRFLKTGHKFIWVRRTEEETQTTKGAFFNKKKLLKKCGLTEENVKVKGNYGYIKMGRKWVDCVEFCSLSAAANQRSNDDEAYDLMIVDEAFATPARVNMFRGNEVTNFIDLWISKKRDHKMTVFLLGNKEIINNPYYQYFGITPPPQGFQGVRRFRDGTLLVWTMTDFVKGDDHTKVDALLNGTPYHDYMFSGAAKTQSKAIYGEKPKRAKHYAAIDFGTPFTIWKNNGTLYVRGGVDGSRWVFVSRETMGKYQRDILTTSRDKERFLYLAAAIKRNKVIYQNPLVCEAATSFFERMGLVK